MAGLKATTARLAGYQRQIEKLLAAGRHGIHAPASSRLVETADFGADPGNLRMLSHVPEGLPPRAPLVVVLHGCTQTGSGYDAGAGWSELAERLGFAVLVPEQRRENNPNLCFNWFLPDDTKRGGGEPESIRRMVERMVVDHDLDRRRVFVTGLSAGGAMTSVLLAAYPDVFAGGAIIAGLPHGVAGNVQEALAAMSNPAARPANQWGDKVREASPHRGPWPCISIWHGDADGTVAPGNASEIEKQWANVHGLAHAQAETEAATFGRRRSWRNAAGEVVLESYSIAGMAHGTPIEAEHPEEGVGAAMPYILEAGISSSYRIARFWGLAGESSARSTLARKDAPAAATRVSPTRAAPASAARAAGARLAVDPQEVIKRALKAAGLLKS